MQETNERLRPFLDAIREAAEESCRAVQQETAAYTKAEMTKAEQQAHDLYEEQYQSGIRAVRTQADVELAAYRAAARARVSQLRLAYEQAVFRDARQALAAFAATPAYTALLLHSAQRLAVVLQPYPQADAVLLVRPADMSLEAQLQEAFGRPCTVRADESIALGGLRLCSEGAHLTVDDTLETRLEQQKPQFRLTVELPVL